MGSTPGRNTPPTSLPLNQVDEIKNFKFKKSPSTNNKSIISPDVTSIEPQISTSTQPAAIVSATKGRKKSRPEPLTISHVNEIQNFKFKKSPSINDKDITSPDSAKEFSPPPEWVT